VSLERFIQFIQQGEPVSPGTPNRPMRQLDQNIKYLWDVIQAAGLGSTVWAREQTIEPDAKIGMPVYYNPTTQRFERALANVETDGTTGEILTAQSSQVWGIIGIKHNATLADLLLYGYDDIDVSEALGDPGGEVPAGLYHLSNQTAGFLTTTKPPVSVPVLRADGNGNVFVNPTFMDFLDSHRHYRFELDMSPAGDTTQPVIGDPHVITNPDSTLSGWLPADDAIFEGNAPEGAKFGYNLSMAGLLNDLWPPLPVTSTTIDLLRPSFYEAMKQAHLEYMWDVPQVTNGSPQSIAIALEGAQVGDSVVITPDVTAGDVFYEGHVDTAGSVTIRAIKAGGGSTTPGMTNLQVVCIKDPDNWREVKLAGTPFDDILVIDRYGIWWMSDCFDECPWPTNLETNPDASVSESVGATPDCPRPTPDIACVLWFTKVNFSTEATVVTSLRSVDDRVKILCRDTTKPGTTGDLDIDLDLQLTLGDDDRRGYLVFKELDGDKIHRGPVTEGVYATSSNVLLTSQFQTYLIPGDPTSAVVHHGLTGLGVLTEPTRELSSQLVRLDGVTEEFDPVLYLGFPDDVQTSFIVKFEVPADAPANSSFAYRTRLLGRAAGTLPPLTVEYNIASRPPAGLDTPVLVTSSWTALTCDTTGVLAAADESVEAESDAFAAAPGDIVYVRVTRDPEDLADEYAGEVGIMQQVGVLTSAGS
jgi:hypothetical protein